MKTGWVTIKVMDGSAPAIGSATMKAEFDLLDVDGNAIIRPTYTSPIGRNGVVLMEVPASDDPDSTPTNYPYSMEIYSLRKGPQAITIENIFVPMTATKSNPVQVAQNSVFDPVTDVVHFEQVSRSEFEALVQQVESLPGGGGEVSSVELQAHISSATPHPAYDTDIPSLRLIFENGLI